MKRYSLHYESDELGSLGLKKNKMTIIESTHYPHRKKLMRVLKDIAMANHPPLRIGWFSFTKGGNWRGVKL